MSYRLLSSLALTACLGAVASQLGCGVLLGLDEFSEGVGGSGGKQTGSGGMGAGGTGGAALNCTPNGMDSVADECGVFVSSSKGFDIAGAGSKIEPFKTLAAAVARAAEDTKRVYACAEIYSETLTLPAGVMLYGGLDCNKKWLYSGSKSTLTAGPDEVPLKVVGSAGPASATDFIVQAADAKKPGGSSIALIVAQATVGLTRCTILPGKGAPGKPGSTPMDNVGSSDPSDPTIKGNNGVDACDSGSQSFGGDSKENPFCPLATGGSVGGSGGVGTILNGGGGVASTATPQTALGGKGQQNSDPSWGCAVGTGTTGMNGFPGDDGAGATGDKGLGKVDASGYVGVSGKDGSDGKHGQGGGGGGAAKGKANCAGASGGGGGVGGCGGKGGKGGMAGGSSIGIVSVGAMVSFVDVNILVGTGGEGGVGGDGKAGGAGGLYGLGGQGSKVVPYTLPGCQGGAGGTGGGGGKGGGGRGGHAIGLAMTGSVMPDTKGVSFVKGTPGLGGKGGLMGDGDPGVQADVQAFP